MDRDRWGWKPKDHDWRRKKHDEDVAREERDREERDREHRDGK